MAVRHRDGVRRSFAAQPEAFEDPSRHFRRDEVVDWLVANTPAVRGDLVLDVAAGTAIFGRALAPVASCVVAVDLTAEMLAAGRQALVESGTSNVVFALGDATVLPFVDHSFDRVVSRLALHHFDDPTPPLRKMARVCRVGGTLTVVDMVVTDPENQARFNELEALRDPAHTRALTTAQLHEAVTSTGATIAHTATRANVLDGEQWLQQTGTPDAEAEQIRTLGAMSCMAGRRPGCGPDLRKGASSSSTTADSSLRE